MPEISSEQRTVALRQLQHAANMLSGRQFADALGLWWDAPDGYAKNKYADFRELGKLHVFSDATLMTLLDYYARHFPEPPGSARDQREQQIVDLAEKQWAKDGEIEFDSYSLCSEGDDNGAYVSGWLWVDFDGTDLDKGDADAC
ncbi:MAG TPA: hypothetical protein VFB50_13985 [Chloroflexota bacterium]|nr:hypothetical protein [Chloroflexota bacterium]